MAKPMVGFDDAAYEMGRRTAESWAKKRGRDCVRRFVNGLTTWPLDTKTTPDHASCVLEWRIYEAINEQHEDGAKIDFRGDIGDQKDYEKPEFVLGFVISTIGIWRRLNSTTTQ